MYFKVLGVFDWYGNNPLPPEVWMLSYRLPVHPGLFRAILSFFRVARFMSCWYTWCYCAGRMWCHCRMVYLPMCYVYGKRFVGRITPLILELRNELYKKPYSEINWDSARNLCAKVCLPQPFLLMLMCVKQFIKAIIQVLMRPWWARINGKSQVDLVVPMWSSSSTESLLRSPIPKVQSL
jgi:cycloartenol synthase